MVSPSLNVLGPVQEHFDLVDSRLAHFVLGVAARNALTESAKSAQVLAPQRIELGCRRINSLKTAALVFVPRQRDPHPHDLGVFALSELCQDFHCFVSSVVSAE